ARSTTLAAACRKAALAFSVSLFPVLALMGLFSDTVLNLVEQVSVHNRQASGLTSSLPQVWGQSRQSDVTTKHTKDTKGEEGRGDRIRNGHGLGERKGDATDLDCLRGEGASRTST